MDDRMGYWVVSKRNYRGGETLISVSKLPTRYGEVAEVAEQLDKQNSDPDVYYTVTELTLEERKELGDERK